MADADLQDATNESYHAPRENKSEATYHPRPGERDPFDTEVEDLTDSLLSNEFSAQAVQENQPRGRSQDRHAQDNSSHPGFLQLFNELSSHVTDTRDMAQAGQGQHANGGMRNTSDGHDASEDKSDHSDASDDEPNDDPTVTYTPEQAARIVDLSRQGRFFTRRPMVTQPPEERARDAASSPTGDLFDVSDASPVPQKRGGGRESLSRNQSAPPPLPGSVKPAASKGHERKSSSSAQPTRNTAAKAQSRRPTQDSPKKPDGPSGSGERTEQPKVNEVQGTQTVSQDGAPKQAVSAKGKQQPPPANKGQDKEPVKNEEDLLDYPPSVLATMSYTDLQNQPYDHDPKAAPTTTPGNQESSNSSAPPADLSSKLTQLLSLPGAEQKKFFNQQGVAEWEESGDWFLEQFTKLTDKLKEARREKRRAAIAFEEEIAEREKLVRKKTQGFDEVMIGLKKGGRGLLLGGSGGKEEGGGGEG